jgi:hypothetical protein
VIGFVGSRRILDSAHCSSHDYHDWKGATLSRSRQVA